MMLSLLTEAARHEALDVLGTCKTAESDALPPGTLALLGPAQGDFWLHFTQSPEFLDNNPNPLDRWSRRVMDALAETVGGTALFPFGEPAQPFISWALRSGRCWVSPVGLLVHDEAGLWVSFRGAILMETVEPAPTQAVSPCNTCPDRPCLSACPVSAMSEAGYDLATCHTFLDSFAGKDCMERGCAVRRACPVSARQGRPPAQSAFHMRAFHPRQES